MISGEPADMLLSFHRILPWLYLSLLLGTRIAVADAAADPLARPSNREAIACLLQGNRLYAVREFERAIEQYKAGAMIEDAPVFQYNLAQTYRVTGRYEDALWHYERFVKKSHPTGELRRTVDGFMMQMRQEIDRAAMKRQPTAVAPQRSQAEQASQQQEGDATKWYHDKLGWGLSAAGLLAMSVGIYLFVDAADIDDQALAESQDSRRVDLRNSASSRRTTGYILAGAALSAVGIGTLRLALHADHDSSSATLAIAGRF